MSLNAQDHVRTLGCPAEEHGRRGKKRDKDYGKSDQDIFCLERIYISVVCGNDHEDDEHADAEDQRDYLFAPAEF